MAVRYKAELGQAIARRRKELGLTQKDLAELTHYKEAQTVSRWERGENLPGDLEIVASALNWTLPELMAGIVPPDRRAARKLGIEPDVSADKEPTNTELLAAIRSQEEAISQLEDQIRLLRADLQIQSAEESQRTAQADPANQLARRLQQR